MHASFTKVLVCDIAILSRGARGANRDGVFRAEHLSDWNDKGLAHWRRRSCVIRRALPQNKRPNYAGEMPSFQNNCSSIYKTDRRETKECPDKIAGESFVRTPNPSSEFSDSDMTFWQQTLSFVLVFLVLSLLLFHLFYCFFEKEEFEKTEMMLG